jgi:hypothetical protein
VGRPLSIGSTTLERSWALAITRIWTASHDGPTRCNRQHHIGITLAATRISTTSNSGSTPCSIFWSNPGHHENIDSVRRWANPFPSAALPRNILGHLYLTGDLVLIKTYENINNIGQWANALPSAAHRQHFPGVTLAITRT